MAMLVGKRMPTSPFPHITLQKILQLLWPIPLSLIVEITSNLVQRHVKWSYRPYIDLVEIDFNLPNHVSNDII